MGLNRFQNVIRKLISSVGRIDVPIRPWFGGTCFVVAEGLVVTNRHVLEEIATQDAAGTWTMNWPDATTVDFVGEDDAVAGTKFKVTGVAFAGPDPINRSINFAHQDTAILRVDPEAANLFPMPSRSRPIQFSRKRAATSTWLAFRESHESGGLMASRRPDTRPHRLSQPSSTTSSGGNGWRRAR